MLGGIGIFFGGLGILFDVFQPVQFVNLLPRDLGRRASEPDPGRGADVHLHGHGARAERRRETTSSKPCRCYPSHPRRPGDAVTVMGTIMAATTGIVGASVVMLTLVALPTMLERGYQKELTVGTIASAGTLGILIPPSIMLVIMGDLLAVPVGTLFAGAIFPAADPVGSTSSTSAWSVS